MCIAVFMWQHHPLYPFLLLFNRDEFHSRPTKAVEWWEGEEILGGRDVKAGGTWLACSKHGKLAFLTNFRELHSIPNARSRGDLPIRFLKSKKSPAEFAEEIVEEVEEFNGFNLVVLDIKLKSMLYITNRPEHGTSFVTEVSPGIHVLTNARLDSPWPKAQRLSNNFKELLSEHKESELSVIDMVEKLMRDTAKDDGRSSLPGIYPPEKEYNMSSIFIDTDFPLQGRYGTRTTTALCVKSNGEVTFYDTHLEDNNSWKDDTFIFHII